MTKKIKEKKTIHYGFILILITAIFSFSVIAMNTEENAIETNANAISNQKIGWGI